MLNWIFDDKLFGFMTILFLVVLIVVGVAAIMTVCGVGLPQDSDLQKVQFMKYGSDDKRFIYCSNYEVLPINESSSTLIAYDCYESQFFGFKHTALRKSFKISAWVVNSSKEVDPYFIPVK